MLNAGRPPEIRVDRPFLLYFEMTLYIILLFIALCAGMALSVYAFGTGGKRKRIFQDIYFSVEDTNGVGVLYTKTGEYSAILKIENPVQKYCANIDSYYEFTHLFTALAQTLGEGYALHKQDIFIRKQFENETGDKHEFLSSAYFRYFKGRNYTDSVCYLTITQEAKKSRLFSFDNKKWRDFLVKIRKVHDQLHDAGVQARFLNKAEASEYVDRYFAMNFKERIVSMTNFKADDETVSMGDKRCKVYSLVDVDCAVLFRPFRTTFLRIESSYMRYGKHLMPFPEHGILHLRGRPAGRMMAVHHRQAVNIPCQPADGEAKYDDEKQRPVHVGEALHLGRSLVDACCLGETPSGIYVTLVAFLVFRVVPVRHFFTEQHTSESFDIHRADGVNSCFSSFARCPCSAVCASSR